MNHRKIHDSSPNRFHSNDEHPSLKSLDKTRRWKEGGSNGGTTVCFGNLRLGRWEVGSWELSRGTKLNIRRRNIVDVLLFLVIVSFCNKKRLWFHKAHLWGGLLRGSALQCSSKTTSSLITPSGAMTFSLSGELI